MSPIRVRTKNHTQETTTLATDFARLGTSAKLAKDAVLDLGKLTKGNTNFSDIAKIERAILDKDYDFLRESSRYFYEASGIYQRLVRYLSTMLTYDWMATPYTQPGSTPNKNTLLKDYHAILGFMDSLNLKGTLGKITLDTVLDGVYYGYRRESATRQVLQKLPTSYCRSRFNIDGMDVVEFNVQYFEDQFKDPQNRLMVLKSFPKEFQQGYLKMKNGTLEKDKAGGYWIMLDPEFAVKFQFPGSEMPLLVATIPSILQLDKAQDIYDKKSEQELLKLVIQKMPMTKEGELVFDIDEAQEMHTNIIRMLSKAVGVDVLTTFADTEVQSLVDRSSSSMASDPLSVMERSVFNEAGISQQLFATDGNLALEKSVASDESLMFTLLAAYESWLNYIVDKKFNKSSGKYYFRVNMPNLTRYNYKEMAKLYKEQAQLGYSKMLPAIALGQSQSSVLATAYFENEILNLSEVMQPLQMSSTQSGTAKAASTGDGKAGRPEKANDQKSDKTIQNKQSQG